MGPPYDYEGAAAQLPSNQRQMMSAPPQAHLLPGGNNAQHHQQQQQLSQMSVANNYGSYPGQQQHHRPSMTMQGGPQGGNPGFMHQASPNQAHRNSLPPPMNMNMGHQYLNQGGYNPNFNPNQGMPQQQQQQQHPQYGHPPQQHGYPPQQHLQQHPIPQQQQHQMQRQNTGGYSHPSQQQQLQLQQQQQQPQQQQQQPHQQPQQQQQPYGQQPNYVHQSSNAGSNQSESQVSTVTGAPLNFNTTPTIDGNDLTGGVEGPNVGGLGGDYGQLFLPSGLNGDWQSDNDMHHRREMIQHM